MKRMLVAFLCVLAVPALANAQTGGKRAIGLQEFSKELKTLVEQSKVIDTKTGTIQSAEDAWDLICATVKADRTSPGINCDEASGLRGDRGIDPRTAFLIHVVTWTDPIVPAALQDEINKKNARVTALQLAGDDAEEAAANEINAARKKELMAIAEAKRKEAANAETEAAALEATAKAKQSVKSSHWYLLAPHADFTGTRMFGATTVWVVSFQLNLSTGTPLAQVQPVYDVVAKAKTPSAFLNLIALADLFPGMTRSLSTDEETPLVRNAWGAASFRVAKTSDIAIGAQLGTDKDAGQLGEPVTFDNEGLSRFDANVGIPIRRAKDLTAATDGSVADPKTVSKDTAFGLLHYFAKPIDNRASGLRRVPAATFGVGLTTRNLLVGASWGPFMANFYGGAVFVWDKETKKYSTKPAWQFGVTVPVKWFVEKTKK